MLMNAPTPVVKKPRGDTISTHVVFSENISIAFLDTINYVNSYKVFVLF